MKGRDRDPQGPHQGQAARQGRRGRGRRPPVAGLLRRRPRQPRQRGGDPRRPAQQEGHRHVRVPGGARADRRRPGAQVAGSSRTPRRRSSPTTRAATPSSSGSCRSATRSPRSRSSAAAWPSATRWPCRTEDRYLQSKTEFEDKIAGLLGGNVAERLIFGDTTTGASNDIEKATDLARRMVTEFGMSDKLGPLSFGKRDELVFLGREIGEQRNYSDEVAQTIDEEVRAIIDKAYERATEVLTTHRDKLVGPGREARRRGDRRRRGVRGAVQRPAAQGGHPRRSRRSSARASPRRPDAEPAAGLIPRRRPATATRRAGPATARSFDSGPVGRSRPRPATMPGMPDHRPPTPPSSAPRRDPRRRASSRTRRSCASRASRRCRSTPPTAGAPPSGSPTR